MKYLEEIRTHNRKTGTLAEFIATYPVLVWLAGVANVQPVDFIAESFVEEVNAGETYENWVVRQVKATLETQIWRDDACDTAPGQSTHMSHRVKRVELNDKDRQYILDTFAPRPDVRRCWESAHARLWARAA